MKRMEKLLVFQNLIKLLQHIPINKENL